MVDRFTQDSALRNDESVWTAYSMTKAKAVERLRAAEVAIEDMAVPDSEDQNGSREEKTLTAPTIALSNLAIRKALRMNSVSL
jgi:hypothetical protein